MVSSFKEFRSDVKTFLGFPWDTENVYFFQERDRYDPLKQMRWCSAPVNQPFVFAGC